MYNVLYVDDEPTLLELGKLFLEKEGTFAVDTLTSAKEALLQLNTVQYAAIIADYQMPDMDGIAFLKHFRASGDSTPFIIFTGRGREEIVIEALNEGADFYLQKGGDPKSQFAELANKIRHAVSRREAEDAVAESEQRLSDIINFLPDATFAIDTEGRVIAWNKAIEEMTGVPVRDMLGKGNYEYALPFYGERRPILIDLVSMPGDERTTGRYSNIKKEGDVITAESALPRPRDRYSVLMGKASVLYNSKGGVVGAIESIRDITEKKQVEKALQESEERFRELSDLLPQVVYEADINGNLRYANHIAFELFGYSEDEFRQGLNVMQMLAPGDRERGAAARRAIFEGKGISGSAEEYQALRKDGSTFPISIYSSPVIVDGRITGLRGIIVDISDRKRAEESLRESEQKHRILLDNSSDPIFSFSPDGTYQYVNRAFAEGVGKTVDQITGKKIWDVFPKNEAEKRFSALRTVFATGNGHEFEGRVPRPDGDRYYVTTIVPIRDDRGSVLSAICSSKEITGRKRAEVALRKSEEKYRHMIENSHDIIYTMTPEGIFIYVSPSWTVLLGHPVTEVVGRSFQQFVHPEDIPGCVVFLQKTIEGTRQPDVEYRVLHADGSWRWHISKSVPLRDETDTVIGFEGIASDITGRKQVEEALRQANNKLNLLSGITRHDINNQLTVLNSFLELLHEKNPDPSREVYFTRITEASTRISAMIEFTREYEKIGVEAPTWQDCRTLVDTAAKQAPLRKVMVKNDLPAGTEVFADPLVVKVFYNLMDNAVRYGGKITSIRFSAEEHHGNQHIICEDDGDGVVAEEKERIFERGFGKNTGLGLALSREILDITGITIRETGEPGKGARFEMTVPKGSCRLNKK